MNFAVNVMDAIREMRRGEMSGISPRELVDLLRRMNGLANELSDKASALLRDQHALEMCARMPDVQLTEDVIEETRQFLVVEQEGRESPFFLLQSITGPLAYLQRWCAASIGLVEPAIKAGRPRGANASFISALMHLHEAWWLATGREPGVTLSHYGRNAGRRSGPFPQFALLVLQTFGWFLDRQADHSWATKIQDAHAEMRGTMPDYRVSPID